MITNAAGAAIARICSGRILLKSNTITTPLAAVSSYRFAFFCSTLVTADEKPISNLSSISDLDGAICLFRDMVRMQPQPSVVEFTKLLNSVVKMKHYFAVLKLFDEMRERGAPVNDYTLNILINCYCNLNRVDLGFSILGSFLKCGYKPSVITFTTLLKGLLLEENFSEGEKLFKKLFREKYCEPNEVMIVTIMDGLCKARETRKAYHLLWLWQKKGYKPYVGCYNTLINRLSKDGKFDAAYKLFSIMIGKHVLPDVVTYSSMIQGLCHFGRWKEAKDLLNEMQARKVTPSLQTSNIFLHGLCKIGQINEAFSVLSMMENNGVDPDIETYNILIKGLCANGKLDVARNLFEELPSKGLQPNIKTFTTIIGALCMNQLTEGAKDLFRNMQKSGCSPNRRTYNVLLHGFLKRNQSDEAIQLFEEMTKRGFSPNSVNSLMLIRNS